LALAGRDLAGRDLARPGWDGWAVAAAGLLVRLLVVWWAWDQIRPTADGSY